MIKLHDHLEVREGVCRFCPRGECSLIEAVELITEAFAYCRNQGITKLFVDVTDLVGLPIPSLVDRFLMIEEWAHEGKGLVVAAMVALPEYIHPEKFGVRVAADLGLMADIFTSEEDALKWLSSNPDPGERAVARPHGNG
jgi:hypothetical protein